MLSIDDLRAVMKEELLQDQAQKNIEVGGSSLEDALKQASIEFNLPPHLLDYEVLTRGYGGVMGLFFKKDWLILVYAATGYKPTKLTRDMAVCKNDTKDDRVQNKDGDFGLRLDKDGHVYLKVIAPIGAGKAVTIESIMKQASSMRHMPSLSEQLINNTVLAEANRWISIATFEYNYNADPEIAVAISEDKMSATVTISSPSIGGSTPTAQEIRQALLDAGVLFGIKEDTLAYLEYHLHFRSTVVAVGEAPIYGKNTSIKFLFDVDFMKIDEENRKKKERIDHKEVLRHIQNVSTGDVVAKVLAPEQGKPGRTVKGDLIPSSDGSNVEIVLGNNVKFSDDRTEILATAAGQALLIKGVIHVETIKTISGDLKSHIDFLGTIVIKGNIEDGYEVNAQGDIHISGTVGRSSLTAGGNIYVAGGINGDKMGEHQNSDHHNIVKCGKSIWSRFIQNSYVEAGEFVIVSDGILNSEIVAFKKVLCKGKRAAIIGGRIRSFEEINAAILGSSSGTPTYLEVGLDPHLKDDLHNFIKACTETANEQAEVERTLTNWQNASKGKSLPLDKLRKFEEIEEKKNNLTIKLNELRGKVIETEKNLKLKKVEGRISASQTIHAGVFVTIRESEYEVTNEYQRAITFYESDNIIATKTYEDIRDNISKANIPFTNSKRK